MIDRSARQNRAISGLPTVLYLILLLTGIAATGLALDAAHAQTCGPGEVLWEGQHLTVPECTCADLPDVLGWLKTAQTYRELNRKMADDLLAKEAAGMSVPDSQAEFKRRETAGTGAVQAAQGTSGAFATTHGNTGECYTCIPASAFRTKCRAFLEAVWVHEKVHRDACTSRDQSRTDPYSLAGSYHAREEQIAYAAQISTYVREIERLLKKIQIEWTTSGPNFDQRGSAQLRSTVVMTESFFNSKGSGSVTFNLQAPDPYGAAPIANRCRTVRGAPATVPVELELEMMLDPPPGSAVFTVHTDGTDAKHTFSCKNPTFTFQLPIKYVGAAYFFDNPIKDGSMANKIMPPGIPHQNFSAKLKCF